MYVHMKMIITSLHEFKLKEEQIQYLALEKVRFVLHIFQCLVSTNFESIYLRQFDLRITEHF